MPRRPLPRDVRKAMELLQSGSGRRLDVARLAQACCVAPRTLQKHFRAFLGSSPARYLRNQRMAYARRDLLRAAPGASVTRIALRHGFPHLGRFAASYRARYGEPPSATLDKALAVPAPAAAPRLWLARRRPGVALLPFELPGTPSRRDGWAAGELGAALYRLGACEIVSAERARYHICGRLESEGGGLPHATVFLVEARTGRRLWADRWIGVPGGDVEGGREAAAQLAGAIEHAIRGSEVCRAALGDPSRMDAWELSMRALPYALSFDPVLETRAIELLERAMDSAPDDALPPALAAWCHGLLAGHHLARDPRKSRASAGELARRAARLADPDPLVEVFLAGACSLVHDLPAAANHVGRALWLDGGSAWAWGRSGWVKAYAGESAEAIERFAIARDLAPGDCLEFLWAIGIGSACLERGEYERAIEWYRQALVERPSATWNDRFRAAACALADRREEARAVLAGFSRAFPEVTIADVRAGLPYSPGFLDRVCEGLEGAGMRC